MKWNLAPSLTLNKKRNSMKIQMSCRFFFFAPNFLFFVALSFMFFAFFTLKLHFSEILMTRYLAVVLKVTGKQTITTFVRAILNRLLQITPRTKIFSLFKTLSRFFTNNIFLYLHSKSSADFLFKQF